MSETFEWLRTDRSLIIGPLRPSTGDVRQAKADGTGQALALNPGSLLEEWPLASAFGTPFVPAVVETNTVSMTKPGDYGQADLIGCRLRCQARLDARRSTVLRFYNMKFRTMLVGIALLYIDELPSTQAVFDGGVASVGASTDCGREQYVDKGRYWCGSIEVEDSWDLCHAAGMRDEPRANLCIRRH